MMKYNWPSRIVFVRHAQSLGNTLGRNARATIPEPTYAYPLTDLGRQQAAQTGEYIKDVYKTPFDVHFTSYYKRAIETHSIMYPDVKAVVDPRLAEAQRGIYQTMTREAIADKYPEEVERKKKEGLYHYRPPGGENWVDIEVRIHSFLQTLRMDYSGQKVLIVGHGHWFLLMRRILGELTIEEAVKLYTDKEVTENASVTHFTAYESGLLNVGKVVPWQNPIG